MQASESFNTMLLNHLPRLKAYAMMLTKNKASAEDLLQETAYRVLRAELQFTIGTNFTAWVYRILRNQFISSLRRSKRTPAPIDDIPESFFAQPPEQEDVVLSNQILRAMDKLHPEQRKVLMLVCTEGLSYDEAAKTLNCSLGTVKSRLWRARKHMEQLILTDSARKPRMASRKPITVISLPTSVS
jgi:RNA polymerase sigma-70 factor (ECF subfamily)